jgi:hypothetical protein
VGETRQGRGRESDAESSLRELQRLVRRPPDASAEWPPPLTMRLPDDLASDDVKTLSFLRGEVDAADRAAAALLADLRFEGLDHAKDKVQRFMSACWADKSGDRVPVFVELYAAEVKAATCYIPVQFLSVTSVMEFQGVGLLPVDDPQIPPPTPWFVLDKPTGCVAAVEVEGELPLPWAGWSGLA